MEVKQSIEIKLRQKIVGSRLKTWRNNVGLSQGEVAKRLQYGGAQFVSNWERGLSLPPMDVLPKLLSLYNIAPATLVDTITEYQELLLDLQRQNLMKFITDRQQ